MTGNWYEFVDLEDWKIGRLEEWKNGDYESERAIRGMSGVL